MPFWGRVFDKKWQDEWRVEGIGGDRGRRLVKSEHRISVLPGPEVDQGLRLSYGLRRIMRMPDGGPASGAIGGNIGVVISG
jgi:hypothetical protein